MESKNLKKCTDLINKIKHQKHLLVQSFIAISVMILTKIK